MKMGTRIEIGIEYRPCIAKGQKALFHKWGESAKPYIKMEFEGGKCEEKVLGQRQETFGIVEFETGEVCRVLPQEITFCDNLISQYAFDKEGTK